MEYFNSNEISSELEEVARSTDALPDFYQELIEFSSIKRLNDIRPIRHSTTIGELVRRLGKHSERKDKEGPAIIPAVFKDGMPRAAANVERLTALVLDIDKGPPYDVLFPKFKPFAHVYHTTHSHTPEHPRYRVIIFLAQPIAVDQWAVFWSSANRYFGHMDEATKDPCRLFYSPAHPPGAEFETRFNPGVLLTAEHLSQGTAGGAEQQELPAGDAHAPESMEQPGDEGNGDLKPTEGLATVVEKCAFMQYASNPENQGKLSEPVWMALITNACGFVNSDAWIHAASEHHDEYDEVDTQGRIDRYRAKYTPMSCARIHELGFDGCPKGGCKTKKKQVVKAPAGLWGWIKSVPLNLSSNVVAGKEAPSNSKNDNPSTASKTFQDIVAEKANKLFGGHIAFCPARTMAYGAGYWKPIEPTVDLQKALLEELGRGATVFDVDKIIRMMEVMYATKEESFDSVSNLICLRNGTLDPAEGKLLPHSPDHYLSNQVDIVFDPAASCPLWLQTLDEIFAPDPDKEDKIRLIQEFFGYCIVPDTRFHKFLWLVGGGGNGKSLVLAVLIALLGRANVSAAQIERLESPFVRAELQGKLVNISSEMSAHATIADGYLKQIVSGDMIEAERKFERPFSFKPYARLIAATNALPRLLDHSDGFFRRAIIVRFNRQFLEHEQDKQREPRLMAELAGILNWALAGRTALYKREGFLIPGSSIVEVSQYRVDSDPVQQFADEKLVVTPSGGNNKNGSLIYDDYRDWSGQNGYRPLANNAFSKRMEALGFKKGRNSRGRYWEVRYQYEGIIVDDASDESTISELAKNYQV